METQCKSCGSVKFEYKEGKKVYAYCGREVYNNNLETGEWVTGDLAYVNSWSFRKKDGCKIRIVKPMIVKHYINGGMLYITIRHFIDENTLELINNGTENQI